MAHSADPSGKYRSSKPYEKKPSSYSRYFKHATLFIVGTSLFYQAKLMSQAVSSFDDSYKDIKRNVVALEARPRYGRRTKTTAVNDTMKAWDHPCLYDTVLSCLQRNNFMDEDDLTFAEQHHAMKHCVSEWLATPSFGLKNKVPSYSHASFQTTGKGKLKDRLDWALYRLDAREAARINLQNRTCGPSAPKNLLPPSWGSTGDLPQVTQNAITGGAYLPPWYAMEEDQEPFEGGFVLPLGPLRRTTAKLVIRDGIDIFVWDGMNNLGDCYNHYLVAMLSGRKVNARGDDSSYSSTGYPFACVTGSVLKENCELVWGSGRIAGEGLHGGYMELYHPDAQVFAVRGPRSLNQTLNGYDNPRKVAFGDPGLLLSLLLPMPEPTEKVDFCVIPHYIDHDVSSVIQLQGALKWSKYVDGYSVKILNIETCSLAGYVQQMSGCRKVLSSSLHGLVFALSYGIPGARLMFSDRVFGGHFKFNDFYKGIGHPDLYIHEVIKKGERIPFKMLHAKLEKTHIPPVSVEDLWNVNPFHAENVGYTRGSHLDFVKHYYENHKEYYPHKPYVPVPVHKESWEPDYTRRQ